MKYVKSISKNSKGGIKNVKTRIKKEENNSYLQNSKTQVKANINTCLKQISKEQGITLIALVVTIVVLLILAGITITFVLGENGIINMAQRAADATNKATQKEQEDLADITNQMQNYLNGNDGSGGTTPGADKLTPDDKGKLVTGENKPYEDETGKAIIPGGFCVVKDSIENPEDKNTVESGLVISDVQDDDLDNSKHGNQFVWIPVEDYSKFHLIEGYYNGNLGTMLSQATNPSREAGASLEAGTPLAKNSTAGSIESIEMYKSVKENKGFYIGRFEAGIVGTTDNYNLSTKTKADGSVKPLVQKGVGVWNTIPWGGTSSDTSSSDKLPGDDTKPGAVVVARSLYPESDTIHKVTSTLCYGVQWDAALNFIDSNYEKAEGNLTSFVADSTDKGNYTGSIAVTGSSQAYQQKHIYDLAGNVYEWTMEAYNTNYRVVRGGSFYFTGTLGPASYRNHSVPDISDNSIRPSPSFIFVTLYP